MLKIWLILELSKLSAADGISLADPEVVRRLTDQVSTAMDEAAPSSLLRFKAEQHQRTSGIDSPWFLHHSVIFLKITSATYGQLQ